MDKKHINQGVSLVEPLHKPEDTGLNNDHRTSNSKGDKHANGGPVRNEKILLVTDKRRGPWLPFAYA